MGVKLNGSRVGYELSYSSWAEFLIEAAYLPKVQQLLKSVKADAKDPTQYEWSVGDTYSLADALLDGGESFTFKYASIIDTFQICSERGEPMIVSS